MIPNVSYRRILTDLRDFEAYLASLTLGSVGRLNDIISNIEEINLACSKGRGAALALQSEATPARLRELVWSLVEGAEWAEIFRGVHNYDRAVIRRLLRKALIGPVDPRLEDNSTNIGRNTTFELRLGARFHQLGTPVRMGGAEDLSVDHAGFRLYVECKRPQTEQNIPKRAAHACAQLRYRFSADSHPNQIGMVAISISKALGAGEMLSVQRERDIESSLTTQARRIYEFYCGPIRNEADSRIVGLICHLYPPTWIRDDARLIAASQFDIFLRNGLPTVLPLSADSLRGLLARLSFSEFAQSD